MRDSVDATRNYKIKCPVCKQVIIAEDFDTGDVTPFTPCEHLVLHYHTAGYFDAFGHIEPNMAIAIECYKQSIMKDKEAFDWISNGDRATDDYEDYVEDQEIFERLERDLDESESHLLIDVKLEGGCCSGPCFNYTDTLFFKMEDK